MPTVNEYRREMTKNRVINLGILVGLQIYELVQTLFNKFLKNETQLNTTVHAMTPRLRLLVSGFKCSYAMVGSPLGTIILLLLTAGIVLDASLASFFPLLVLHKLRRTGREAC